MKQSEAWALQAKSDLAAARAILKDNDASTYCQILAKYQQAAEKSVKGMVAALNELGVLQLSISGSHTLEHEINGLDAFRRKKSGLDNVSVKLIERMIKNHKPEIIELCRLAPSGPKSQIYPKNTEYPYNDGLPTNEWAAPAQSFTSDEVKRYYKLAWFIQHSLIRFVDAARRAKR